MMASTSSLAAQRSGSAPRAFPTTHSSRTPTHSRRTLATPRATSTSGGGPNDELLGVFFYGRAWAATVGKRLGSAVVDAAGSLGSAIATRPQRIQSFRDEVAALAEQEMLASTGYVSPALAARAAGGSDASASGGASASSGAGARKAKVVVDIEEQADDLRATIAQARSVLQAIKLAPPAPASSAKK
ncbi:hypothetical protein FOA52_008102 [Chlamydomonas sp. UWO 241]|nr:hypothetical protein FOA52_008102 [Chlamydomonas sp. UWO 241]